MSFRDGRRVPSALPSALDAMGQKRELTVEVTFTEADKDCLARLVKDLVKLSAKTDKVRARARPRHIIGPFTLMHFPRRTHRRDRVARRDQANARARASTRALTPIPSLPKRVTCLDSQGEFKEWLKATQKGPRRTWHDPARHDWQTLSDFALAAIAKDAKLAEPPARRHLGWSRWAARRAAWRAWQKDQPQGEVPTRGPWSLVARTERHPGFSESYASLPSHLPGWRRSAKQRPPRWCQSHGLSPEMVGVDCEMCETDVDKRALVGVSVVDAKGGVLLKTLVRPPGTILDLKTDITGLRMKDFKGVKTSLADVQEKLRAIVKPNTVLVGHGLVHDLKALKFDHAPVIDTAMLFSYKNLPRSTPGLADLCKRLLSSEMRAAGTHDSVEDARMALELAQWECAQAKPTTPLDPPTDKVDARDLSKLFVHRVPRGTLASDIEGMFAKVNGTIGVEHACDIEAVHGKFLGPDTPLDATRTTSCYVAFESVEKCNAAFKSLRGGAGTDALGRPQKAVKMVVHAAGAKRGDAEAMKRDARGDVSKMTVAALREALKKRGLAVDGLKPALTARLEAAMGDDASRDDSGSDSDSSDSGSGASGSAAETEDFSKLTVPKLREALEARGLDTSGLKAALVARLEHAAKKKAAAKENATADRANRTDDPRKEATATRLVMVRKMAAHGGRAIGTADKTADAPASEGFSGAKRKAGEAEAKKPRRNPRPSRRARLAAKGMYE